MSEEKRRGGGAKATRTETVTVRLDPKLRYLAELAARKQRRTLSSYIEWAVEQSLKEVKLHEGSGYNGDETITVADEAATLWDVDESERFIKLAIGYPALLTHEEQELWKMLLDSGLLGPARTRSKAGMVLWNSAKLDDEVYPEVRRRWEGLKDANARGQEARVQWIGGTKSEVLAGRVYFGHPPKAKNSSGFDDMDDEIPF